MTTSMVRARFQSRPSPALLHSVPPRSRGGLQLPRLAILCLGLALLAACLPAAAAGVPVADPELAQMVTRLREVLTEAEAPAPSDPNAPDATLFVRYDPKSKTSALGRRDVVQGDSPTGTVLADAVSLTRPSVTGDGRAAVFVSLDNDVCVARTGGAGSRECLGFPGRVYSIAISPDATLVALVLIDEEQEELEDQITVLDLVNNKVTAYKLFVPTLEGAVVEAVLFADGMSFSADNSTLFYDAFSQVQFGDHPEAECWSIFSLDLASGKASVVAPPIEGVDTGNPAASRSSDRYLAFDARDVDSGASTVLIVDLPSALIGRVASTADNFAFPSFLSDDSAILFSSIDTNAASGLSVFKQDLSADRLQTSGNPTLWLADADFGVAYRRTAPGAPNAR